MRRFLGWMVQVGSVLTVLIDLERPLLFVCGTISLKESLDRIRWRLQAEH